MRTRQQPGSYKAIVIFFIPMMMGQMVHAQSGEASIQFKRIATQFIAALAEPGASAGDNAQTWGVWSVDPGPRGVRLSNYDKLKSAGNVAPAQWTFDDSDWWLEENGLIMEKPQFPIAAGKYLVTGDRDVVSVLTVHPRDDKGVQRWALGNGASLHDVTHLKCRSARYTPVSDSIPCSPANAPQSAFRVAPGAAMPAVEGCNKQDYAVLFIVAVEAENEK